jgi:RNA polymerase sigma factor (sigma-70 family)
MQPTDDSTLLRQYAESHSDEAFATLVTRHINLVYSVGLRYVGNPHSAEEVTQEVFVILAKKALQLRHERALSSWLFQTTRLTANNFIRSEIRRNRRETEAYMQSVLDETEPELWPKISPLLDTAVAGLREKDRQAIVLRFYEGQNLREVGLALGTSQDAAEKRVSRALEKLRTFFTKRGVSSTTADIAGAISINSVQAAPVALAKSVTAVALAKGAAASGSTLTLIKGALKIMAWTKAKTGAVIGAAVILAAGTTTLVVKHQHQADGPVPQSSWAFVKYATPEAAFQSSLWAMSKGDIKTLTVCYTTEFANKFKETAWKGKTDNELVGMFTQMAGMIGDFQAVSNEVVSSDETILHFHSSRIGDASVPMKKIENEWKINGNITTDGPNNRGR